MVPEVLAAQIRPTTTFPRIGPLQPPSTLEELVRYIFILTVVILGLLIFWRLIRAGISWMLAGEDAQKIQAAKTMIWNAFLGAILILSSVIFLNTLSPNFINLLVSVESPRKVSKYEIVSSQKGVAFCKSQCEMEDINCIEDNCEIFTGGIENVENLVKSGYHYIMGYGDGQSKENFAIFFDKDSYELSQSHSASKVRIWLEKENRAQEIDSLSDIKTVIVGSYNPSEGKEIIVHLCNTIDPISDGDFSTHCATFSASSSAFKSDQPLIGSCNVCNRVRKIIIEHKGYVLFTQNSRFGRYALYLLGPQPEIRVAGLAHDRWAQQDMCIDKRDREEKKCDEIPAEYRQYLPPYIQVNSILLIPQ